MASPTRGRAKPPSWFLLLETEPRRAAENMARDEYLFRLCHERKCGFFRIYAWERPSFSTGVSQKADKALNLDFIKANGCDYVRRITGGKTVLHDHEITYAVASSEDLFFKEHDLHQSYLLISRVLVQALQSLGVEAALSQGSPSELSRSHNPCFSFPTPNEIEVNGKKIIGSAQKRDKQALLQHGSIPLTMNYDLYAGGANFTARFHKKKHDHLERHFRAQPPGIDRCPGAKLQVLYRNGFLPDGIQPGRSAAIGRPDRKIQFRCLESGFIAFAFY